MNSIKIIIGEGHIILTAKEGGGFEINEIKDLGVNAYTPRTDALTSLELSNKHFGKNRQFDHCNPFGQQPMDNQPVIPHPQPFGMGAVYPYPSSLIPPTPKAPPVTATISTAPAIIISTGDSNIPIKNLSYKANMTYVELTPLLIEKIPRLLTDTLRTKICLGLDSSGAETKYTIADMLMHHLSGGCNKILYHLNPGPFVSDCVVNLPVTKVPTPHGDIIAIYNSVIEEYVSSLRAKLAENLISYFILRKDSPIQYVASQYTLGDTQLKTRDKYGEIRTHGVIYLVTIMYSKPTSESVVNGTKVTPAVYPYTFTIHHINP